MRVVPIAKVSMKKVPLDMVELYVVTCPFCGKVVRWCFDLPIADQSGVICPVCGATGQLGKAMKRREQGDDVSYESEPFCEWTSWQPGG